MRSTTSTLAATAALAFLLAACGSPQDDAEPNEDEATQEDPERTPTESFEYDQHSVYRDPDTGQSLGTFTITYIDSDYDCDGQPATAVGVEVNTINEEESVTLNPEDFYFVDESGSTIDGSAAPGCDATLHARRNNITAETLIFDLEAESGQIGLINEHLNGYWSF